MQRYAAFGRPVGAAMHLLDSEKLNLELVRDIVAWAVSGGQGKGRLPKPLARPLPLNKSNGRLDGSVLVFLPGLKEIQNCHELILRHPAFSSPEAKRWVLPLHSSLSSGEQKMVFRRPPPSSGVCKVVLATNIAETSVTIDDVVCVVDTGRMKEARYDATRRMASLEDVLVSKASNPPSPITLIYHHSSTTITVFIQIPCTHTVSA